MHSVLHRLELAFRTSFRTPLVTIVAILSLGLGIGANAGIYSLFNELLLAPLPALAAIWLGHWVLEPTSAIEFKHPLLTARANLRMFRQMLSGVLPF